MLYIYFPYINSLQNGEGCVYLWVSGQIQCVDVSTLEVPITRGYAFTLDVITFCLSLSACFFHLGFTVKDSYEAKKKRKQKRS
jgi:hypothetical protein